MASVVEVTIHFIDYIIIQLQEIFYTLVGIPKYPSQGVHDNFFNYIYNMYDISNYINILAMKSTERQTLSFRETT